MLCMHGEYFSHTLTIVNTLRVNKAKIKDVDIIEKILRSMTPQFNYVVCSIEVSKDLDVITIDELQSTLLVHEQRMKPSIVEAFGGRDRVLGDSQSLLIVDGIHVQMAKIDDDLKESEIMCNNASHPGTRRQGGEIGFIYEAEVKKWSSLDFSFALTVFKADNLCWSATADTISA
uniref:Zinc finger, CCHC-type n=1 Tax=Tanacetum cinerariifolium TaxID=118510 RepID=A0A699I5T0_TANCI